MKTFFSAIFCILSVFCHAQTGINTPWAWMKGGKAINQPGVYGVQGVADPLNMPPSIDFATTWKDLDGNLWLFGGIGNGTSNDLWKFDVSTNEWTWMKGTAVDNQPGIYGTLGVSNPANRPGARVFSTGFTDNAGNLWLFGGLGYGETVSGYLNDLWKYNIATNEWTWIKGSKEIEAAPVYGTKGISSPSNTPGAAYGQVAWKDQSGNFWVFGGDTHLSIGLSFTNQLWKFNPLNNEWTWIKGDAIANPIGVYGTIAVADILNMPGSRQASATWIDNAGNLWLFGGIGFTNNGTGFPEELNDVWKYHIATNEWTWIKGANTGDQLGNYGTQGIADPANNPSGRDSEGFWKDADGNFWIFGGYTILGLGNDLWKYDLASNNWTFMKGDMDYNQLGVYGSQGIPAATNKPGCKYGAPSWTDDQYNFWILGGLGYGESASYGLLNDLWRIDGNALVPLKLLNFNGYANGNENLLYWQTSQEINTQQFIIERSEDTRVFTAIGNEAAAGNSSTTEKYSFTDKHPLDGINYYRLKMLDADGKFTYSNTVKIKNDLPASALSVFPNPVNNILYISMKTAPGNATLQILDSRGRTVKQQQIHLNQDASFSIDVKGLAKGNYFLNVVTALKTFQNKFIKD